MNDQELQAMADKYEGVADQDGYESLMLTLYYGEKLNGHNALKVVKIIRQRKGLDPL